MRIICQFVLARRISKTTCSTYIENSGLWTTYIFTDWRLTGTQLCLILCLVDNLSIVPGHYAFVSSFYLLFLSVHRKVTLVICDSRGVKLGPFLQDEDIICIYYHGAGLRFISRQMYKLVGMYFPVTCLVMAGINDLTIRTGSRRLVSPKLNDPFDLANYLIRQILHVIRDLNACYPWLRVAFAGVNGICLDRYKRCYSYPSDQCIIDEAILQINSYIRLLNQNSRLYHPRVTSKVHAWRRGRMVTRYKYLSDGLHPSPILLCQWARAIRKFHRVNTLGLLE